MFCSILAACDDCENGHCDAPNQCRYYYFNLLNFFIKSCCIFFSCYNGWTGLKCDACVTLPGCKNGTCSEPNTCNCNTGWQGHLCDEPECE